MEPAEAGGRAAPARSQPVCVPPSFQLVLAAGRLGADPVLPHQRQDLLDVALGGAFQCGGPGLVSAPGSDPGRDGCRPRDQQDHRQDRGPADRHNQDRQDRADARQVQRRQARTRPPPFPTFCTVRRAGASPLPARAVALSPRPARRPAVSGHDAAYRWLARSPTAGHAPGRPGCSPGVSRPARADAALRPPCACATPVEGQGSAWSRPACRRAA